MIITTTAERKKKMKKMTYEEALEILIQLMIENADVLKRLKEGE